MDDDSLAARLYVRLRALTASQLDEVVRGAGLPDHHVPGPDAPSAARAMTVLKLLEQQGRVACARALDALERAASSPALPDLGPALERLVDGRETEADRETLRAALVQGRLTYRREARTPGASGAGREAVIVLGDATFVGAGGSPAPGASAAYHATLTGERVSEVETALFPRPAGAPPPFPDLVFIGRARAIAEVKAHLGIGTGSAIEPRQLVVRGWPGVGKTTLVAMLARDRDVMAAFPDGVLWTSLDQDPALLSTLAGWARALGRTDVATMPTIKEVTAELRGMLAGKRMLLMVDDVWSAGHGAPFQALRGPGCGLLYTTRSEHVAHGLVREEREIYPLPELALDDAVTLLGVLAPQVAAAHPVPCRELAQDLECLPLALHVAARLLRARFGRGLDVAALLAEIRRGAAILAADAPADRGEAGRLPTVQALLRKSTDLLTPGARDAFAYLGVFAAKPATFDFASMTSVWRVADPSAIAEELLDHGLIEGLGDGRFRMHALLVAHARSLLTA